MRISERFVAELTERAVILEPAEQCVTLQCETTLTSTCTSAELLSRTARTQTERAVRSPEKGVNHGDCETLQGQGQRVGSGGAAGS